MNTYIVKLADLSLLVNAFNKHDAMSLCQESTTIANDLSLKQIQKAIYRHSNRPLIWGVLAGNLLEACPLNRMAH